MTRAMSALVLGGLAAVLLGLLLLGVASANDGVVACPVPGRSSDFGEARWQWWWPAGSQCFFNRQGLPPGPEPSPLPVFLVAAGLAAVTLGVRKVVRDE